MSTHPGASGAVRAAFDRPRTAFKREARREAAEREPPAIGIGIGTQQNYLTAAVRLPDEPGFELWGCYARNRLRIAPETATYRAASRWALDRRQRASASV